MTRLVFLVAAFLGSALLFVVQPIVVRMLLPGLGGSPAVWNTAMVFFQLLLLAGYLYAHGSLRWLRISHHRYLHALVMLLPLVALPIALPTEWAPPDSGDPTIWTIGVLAVMVGAPYFALATASPTLQHWFAHARTDNTDPYALYAAGNAGSVIALLSYPLLLEPMVGLRQQAAGWALAYGVFLLLLAFCSALTRNAPPARGEAAKTGIRWPQRWKWMAFAAIPSVLLLGSTRHIGDEIASFPLLWIVPLALYLATFIITFGNFGARIAPVAARVARLLVIPAALSLFRMPVPLPLVVIVHLALFTSLALVLHQRLYEARPQAASLTEFYVYLSLGGALGGMFVVLVAPFLFDAIYEYPLAIAIALLALPADTQSRGLLARLRAWPVAIYATIGVCLVLAALAGWQVAISDFIESNAQLARLLAGVAGLLAFIMLERPRHYALVISLLLLAGVVVRPEGTVLQDRSFFGVLRIQQIDSESTMFHGTTIHGSQREEIPRIAQGYYHPDGPAGSAIIELQADGSPLSIGIVGLGVGAMAAAGRPVDDIVFYEIDPAVLEAARERRFFTYLADARASVKTVIGDGRLSLQRSSAQHDVLFIDAFSSDAIPVHLLTREAFELYRGVTGGGPVLMHISNRHLNLAPVVGATARAAGLNAWLW
ncbi:MAG: fused MFS/spermidine synthase, partial [Xanthomonadales bacterium]|nr:fused MFS/spermidine synthase [Xanthomonadales bacterium]